MQRAGAARQQRATLCGVPQADEQSRAARPLGPAPQRLYVEIDAAKTPEPDEWKDMKVGVVFDVSVADGTQQIGTKTYIGRCSICSSPTPSRSSTSTMPMNTSARSVTAAGVMMIPSVWRGIALRNAASKLAI